MREEGRRMQGKKERRRVLVFGVALDTLQKEDENAINRHD